MAHITARRLAGARLLAHKLRNRFWALFYKVPMSAFEFCGICPNCLRHSITVGRRRTRTAYVDDAQNFEVSCIDCYEEHDGYWAERWDEYYRGCL